MTSILDGSLAEQLTDALVDAAIPQSCVLTVQEQGGDPWAPTFTDVPHACSGWRDEYEARDRIAGDVLVTDAKVYIVASSLDVTPAVGNSVSVNGVTLGSVVSMSIDPAGACWLLQVRV
jgi:hypothetical protein